MPYLTKDDQYHKLKLSLDEKEFHMFFVGGGLYRLGRDDPNQMTEKSIDPAPALSVIYDFVSSGQKCKWNIPEEVNKVIERFLTYKKGYGVYSAYKILTQMKKDEMTEGDAIPFKCNFDKYRKLITETLIGNESYLKEYDVDEATFEEYGFWGLTWYDNEYDLREYGFLTLDAFTDEEKSLMRETIRNYEHVDGDKLEHLVMRMAGYYDVAREFLYFIKTGNYVPDDEAFTADSHTVKELVTKYNLDPVFAYEYFVDFAMAPSYEESRIEENGKVIKTWENYDIGVNECLTTNNN